MSFSELNLSNSLKHFSDPLKQILHLLLDCACIAHFSRMLLSCLAQGVATNVSQLATSFKKLLPTNLENPLVIVQGKAKCDVTHLDHPHVISKCKKV